MILIKVYSAIKKKKCDKKLENNLGVIATLKLLPTIKISLNYNYT